MKYFDEKPEDVSLEKFIRCYPVSIKYLEKNYDELKKTDTLYKTLYYSQHLSVSFLLKHPEVIDGAEDIYCLSIANHDITDELLIEHFDIFYEKIGYRAFTLLGNIPDYLVDKYHNSFHLRKINTLTYERACKHHDKINTDDLIYRYKEEQVVDFIRKYPNDVDWDVVFKHNNIFEKVYDLCNMKRKYGLSNKSEAWLEKYSSCISSFKYTGVKLSHDFVAKHLDKFDIDHPIFGFYPDLLDIKLEKFERNDLRYVRFLMRNVHLTLPLLEKYKDKIDLNLITNHLDSYFLCKEYVEKYPELFEDKIKFLNVGLFPRSLVEKHATELYLLPLVFACKTVEDWEWYMSLPGTDVRLVLQNAKIDENFLNKYLTPNSSSLSEFGKNITYSDDYIEQHILEFGWQSISEYALVSEKFIEKHHSQIQWNCLSRNYKTLDRLSPGFFEKYFDYFNRDSYNLINYVDDIEWAMQKLIKQGKNMKQYYDVFRERKFSSSFIKKHQDKLPMSFIIGLQDVDSEIFDKYCYQFGAEYWDRDISRYTKLPIEMILKYKKPFIDGPGINILQLVKYNRKVILNYKNARYGLPIRIYDEAIEILKNKKKSFQDLTIVFQ